MQKLRNHLAQLAFLSLVAAACNAQLFAQQNPIPQLGNNFTQTAPLPIEYVQDSRCWNSTPCPMPCEYVAQSVVFQAFETPILWASPNTQPVGCPMPCQQFAATPLAFPVLGTLPVEFAGLSSVPSNSCGGQMVGQFYPSNGVVMNFPQSFAIPSIRPSKGCSGCKSKLTKEELEQLKKTYAINPNMTKEQRLSNCWQYCDEKFPDFPCNGECHEKCPDLYVDECNCVEYETDWGPQYFCELTYVEDPSPSEKKAEQTEAVASESSALESSTLESDSPVPVADDEN